MNSIEAVKNNIQMAEMICSSYLDDLTNEEFMMRPHPGCNHVNWQVGHLVSSDFNMFSGIYPGVLPDLPEGFSDKYTKETTANDNPEDFVSGHELLELAAKQRAAILEKIDSLSESDLDAESPESMRGYAPNAGAVLNMLGTHWVMHAGQWVIVRRMLEKDIVI